MILVFAAALAAATPALPPRGVREMIREAKTLVERDGNAVWPGFKTIPFHMILVTADSDILFCQRPTDGWRAVGADPISGCAVQTRKRELAVDSSASFDVGDEPSMIVMGTPKALGLRRTDWVLTLAHEAFHQYQSRIPGYGAKVTALGLAGNDGSAQWMLDYPFPYADPVVGTAVTDMTGAGIAFLSATSPEARKATIADYVKARRRAMRAGTPDQWRYYEFQIGQEGVARWTERALAVAASRRDRAMARAAADRRVWRINSLRSVAQQGFRIWKRGAFYELGAVEAAMLESVGAPWRQAYRDAPFSVGAQLERACTWQACVG